MGAFGGRPVALAPMASDSDPSTDPLEARDPAHADDTAERRADKVPVRMLSDRILVKSESSSGERRTNSGILIPATAQLAKRLAWAEVRAVGPNVRAVEEGDHVLYNPEEVYEVEVRGDTYIILRERDLHAVASDRLGEAHTGLYL